MNLHQSYKEIGKEFAHNYYSEIDRDLNAVGYMYYTDTYITVIGEEVLGYQAFIDTLHRYSVYRLHHQIQEVDCQPVTDDLMIINVTGQLTSDGVNYNRFSETFTLMRDGGGSNLFGQPAGGNTFHIRNQMLRMIP